MIDILAQLASGFVHCLTPLNLAMLVVGIVIGLLIGVLPGLTLVMGVALALPFTYKMDVTASIVLLTAMYGSGTYGGAFSAFFFRCSCGCVVEFPVNRLTSPCCGTVTPWAARASRPRRLAGLLSRLSAAGFSRRSSWWRLRSRSRNSPCVFLRPNIL